MILRKLSYIILLGLVTILNAEDPKQYDTSEWIPISPQNEDEKIVPIVERKATGRVLNLADPPQKNFFPDDNKPRNINYQQFLRETTNINPYQQPQRQEQPKLRQDQPIRQLKTKSATAGHPYRFENIVPPPPPPPAQRIRQQKPDASQQKYFLQQSKQEYNNPQFIQQQSKQEFNNQFLQPLPQKQEFVKFVPPQQNNQPLRQFAPDQTRQPQFTAEPSGPQFVQQNPPQFAAQTSPGFFAQPQEYHTIPEEYLNAQGLAPQQAQQFYQPNYQNLPVNIPEFPAIRLNATYDSIRQAIEKEKVKPTKQAEVVPSKDEKENVQLLYVPLESLQQQSQQQQQQQSQQQQQLQQSHQQQQQLKQSQQQHQQQQQQQKIKNDLPKLHAYQQAPEQEIQQQFAQVSPFPHRQQQIQNIENDFARQALEAHKLQLQFQGDQLPFQGEPVQFRGHVQQFERERVPQFTREPQQEYQRKPVQQFQQREPTPQFQKEPVRPQVQVEEQKYEVENEQEPYALPSVETTTEAIIATTTTTKRSTSKKRKAHQPPLAVYMGGTDHADVADVLTLLKDAKSIDVQDTVGPNSPKIFVGPSTLDAPEGYAKFELPYLSSLDNNRVERKVDQYPFFVAPLSYKAPPGFSKIPLPSPHVGSVVIKENTQEKISRRPAQQQIEEYVPAQRVRNQPSRVEPYTLPTISASSVRYSKPIPEDHVINQFELDQINGFVPQFQLPETIQDVPEKYSFDVEPTSPYIPQRSTTSKPVEVEQQYLKEIVQPADKYTYETVQEARPNQHKSRPSTTSPERYESQPHKSNRPTQEKYHIRTRPTVAQESSEETNSNENDKYSYETKRPTKTRGTTKAPQQYFKEVTRTNEPSSQEQYFKEVTHSNTPTSQDKYFKEVTQSNAPSSQEQYFKEVTRSNTPTSQDKYFKEVTQSNAPSSQYFKEVTHSNTPTSQDKYFKEVTQSNAPSSQEQYFKEIKHTTTQTPPQEKQTKETTRSSTPPPPQEYFEELTPEIYTHARTTPSSIDKYVSVSSTGKPLDQNVYSPYPTQLSYTPTQLSYAPTQQSYNPTQYSSTRPELDRTKYNVLEEYTKNYASTRNTNNYGSEEHDNIFTKQQSPEESEERDFAQQPIYSPTAASINRDNQHILNQHMMDSVILGQRQQDSLNYISGPQQIYEQSVLNHPQRDAPLVHRVRNQYRPEPRPEIYEDEHVKTQNANVENYNLSPQLPPVSQQLPGLINNLEDQSVRQLLSLGLVPTSEKSTYVHVTTPSPTYPPTTTAAPTSTYPATHLPITETTTQRRTRGRQRAGTRYSTTPSTVSTTRKSIQRGRRPLPPRSRYPEEATTEYPTTTQRTVTVQRQRFRTRGRPTTAQNEIFADRISTTERHGYETPTIRNTPSIRQQTPRLIEEQHLTQHVTPRVTINDEEQYVISSYQPVYNVPAEHSNVLPVSQKVVNVEVTRPQTEVSRPHIELTRARTEPAVIQEINQLPIRNLEEHQSTTDRASVRVRSRVRPKPTRPSSTAAPPQAAEDDSEFYGFFRQPNFRPPIESVATETPQRSVYSSTYISSTVKPTAQYPDEIVHSNRYATHEEEGAPSTVRFVGEIRPKYQPSSTAQYFEVTQPSLAPERLYQSTIRDIVTDPPKVKIRGRVRVPGRRTNAEEVETQRTNELTSRDDTSIRTPVRGRVRGKVHYKVPSKPKDSVEDEEVEGGNYPVNFKSKGTPRPSFQITVDPLLEDQVPYSSQYRPTYLSKEAGSKIVQPWAEDLTPYRNANELPNFEEIKSSTDEAPSALPVVLTSTTEEIGTTESLIDKLVEEIATEEQQTENFKVPFEEIEEEKELTTEESDIEASTKKRRGVWKLVKRPLDVLQSAESQSLGQAKVNTFVIAEKPEPNKFHIFEDSNENKDFVEDTTIAVPEPEPTVASIPTSTEAGFFNSLYEMFGLPHKDTNKEEISKVEPEEDITTDKQTEMKYDATMSLDELKEYIPTTMKSIVDGEVTTQTVTKLEPIVDASYAVKEEFIENTPSSTTINFVTPMSLETWNGVIKTSTSTEISHETEICYKGRCIKSKDVKVPTS